jgi:hypothetical protein
MIIIIKTNLPFKKIYQYHLSTLVKKHIFLVFESHKNITKYFYEISMSNERRGGP